MLIFIIGSHLSQNVAIDFAFKTSSTSLDGNSVGGDLFILQFLLLGNCSLYLRKLPTYFDRKQTSSQSFHSEVHSARQHQCARSSAISEMSKIY